ncbi:hypothetical protein RRG08_059798 [Elysia crispata]|uniref:Uncharacterized protein n=1 Tax=Elysia crispata TaxID=231223 RepID=A0AAE1BCU1_9GAST|nr:hypothetical protein RRG08_059798 [Elysia crispata]
MDLSKPVEIHKHTGEMTSSPLVAPMAPKSGDEHKNGNIQSWESSCSATAGIQLTAPMPLDLRVYTVVLSITTTQIITPIAW